MKHSKSAQLKTAPTQYGGKVSIYWLMLRNHAMGPQEAVDRLLPIIGILGTGLA